MATPDPSTFEKVIKIFGNPKSVTFDFGNMPSQEDQNVIGQAIRDMIKKDTRTVDKHYEIKRLRLKEPLVECEMSGEDLLRLYTDRAKGSLKEQYYTPRPVRVEWKKDLWKAELGIDDNKLKIDYFERPRFLNRLKELEGTLKLEIVHHLIPKDYLKLAKQV